MEKLYRLELNESKQMLRLDNYTHEPNKNGWVTIVENISYLEFKLIQSALNLFKLKKLTKKSLQELISELENFTNRWINK